MKIYNKLVRDKIPEICKAHGDEPTIRIIDDVDEYAKALCAKLREEAQEVEETPNLEELADTLEVLYAIGKTLGHTPVDIEAARVKKAKERGGFEKRIFLIRTEPQH